jgi:hypothetical protein
MQPRRAEIAWRSCSGSIDDSERVVRRTEGMLIADALGGDSEAGGP